MADHRLRWPALFSTASRPVFVLNAARRIRYVNDAWLTLTGEDEPLGKACVRKGPTDTVYRTLAPPRGLVTTATVRRPAPANSGGPPWWDITFLVFDGPDGTATLGLIDVLPARGITAKSLPAQLGALLKQQEQRYPFELFASVTPRGKHFLAKLHHAAESLAPVWIHGEPGSGKMMAARIIHHHSARRELPLVLLDCHALQPYLLEGLLFGTGGVGKTAGTLVLRNPAALPRDLQQRIAEWLLTDSSPPRVICVSPASPLNESNMRPEFASELAVIELTTVPLRQKIDDLEPALRNHTWPGNYRELRQVRSEPELPRHLKEKTLLPAEPLKPRPGLDSLLEAAERNILQRTLADCQNDPTAAAAKLGIPRTRFVRRLEALGS